MTRGVKGSTPRCKTVGCEAPAKIRGYCVKHGQRVRRHGTDATSKFGRWSMEKIASLLFPAANDCLEWRGHVQGNGYGYVRTGGGGNAKRVHRVVWEMARGPIAPGLLLRHLCHNKVCCNLDHLALGTQKENVADSLRAGRRQGYTGNPKLTPDDVRMVRFLLENSVTRKTVAEVCGVSLHSVHNIASGRGWRWVQ